MSVKVFGVQSGSPAGRKGLKVGDVIISIDNKPISDILDYTFYSTSTKPKVVFERDGKKYSKKIKKDEYEDMGLEFETYLMDKHRSCCNGCIFCFVDQMPPGMRESLYFKDDDARLSFLFGNYITLTNMSDRDVDRIIEMKISPINVSVHTVDTELRCKMMNNRFAGRALDILYRFAENGIELNCQLVLCPGYNDGEKLSESLKKLGSLFPSVKSIACVPVGITSFREGLSHIDQFDEKLAGDTIDIIDSYGDEFYDKYAERIAYPSDEFFLLAKREIPSHEYYADYPQLDNGVGMISLFSDEFHSAMKFLDAPCSNKKISVATGVAAYNMMRILVDEAKKKWSDLKCDIFCITNEFFGNTITVAGLITGRDLISQLEDKNLGDILIIPRCMIRYQGDCFLDDITVEEAESKLNVKIFLCENDGGEFLDLLIDGGE